MSVTTQSVAPGTQLQRVGGRATKATIGARRPPSAVSLAAIRAKIGEMIRDQRRSDARLAAMIILVAPDRIGDMPIGDFLMRIHEVERERVAAWLRDADVNPWRAGQHLSAEQRSRLVRILTDFSKGEQ